MMMIAITLLSLCFTEHRVLRIETKQVPVRSQPEVVLSDGEYENKIRLDSPGYQGMRVLRVIG